MSKKRTYKALDLEGTNVLSNYLEHCKISLINKAQCTIFSFEEIEGSETKMKLERQSDFEEILEDLKVKYAIDMEQLKAQGMTTIFVSVGENKEGQYGTYRNAFFNKNGEYTTLKFKGFKIPTKWNKGLYLVSYPSYCDQEVSEREYKGKVYKTLTIISDLDDINFLECNQNKDSQLIVVEDDGLPF